MFCTKVRQTNRQFFMVAVAIACLPVQNCPALAEPANPKSFYGTPLVKSAFPSYDKNAYNKQRLKELRSKTLWSAPSTKEQAMLQAITDSQLQQGADDPRTLNLMWTTAQYFLKVQKTQQAEPLLKELIATIESHARTTENAEILSEAKLKLKEIVDARTRLAAPPAGMRPFVPPMMTPRTGMRGTVIINPRGTNVPGNAQYLDPSDP